MKALNLYAGIGGNRKLWQDVEVTAVENKQDIADVYSHYFPLDRVIVTDAHKYLLEHYFEYDFIWCSTSCPTHSRARFWSARPNKKVKPVYPDMKLYEEILFLKHYFDGKYVVENVKPFYEPLIKPTIELGRHLFWSNFSLKKIPTKEADIKNGKREDWSKLHGFDLSNHKINSRKDQIYRNCVHPETGLFILQQAMGVIYQEKHNQIEMF